MKFRDQILSRNIENFSEKIDLFIVWLCYYYCVNGWTILPSSSLSCSYIYNCYLISCLFLISLSQFSPPLLSELKSLSLRCFVLENGRHQIQRSRYTKWDGCVIRCFSMYEKPVDDPKLSVETKWFQLVVSDKSTSATPNDCTWRTEKCHWCGEFTWIWSLNQYHLNHEGRRVNLDTIQISLHPNYFFEKHFLLFCWWTQSTPLVMSLLMNVMSCFARVNHAPSPRSSYNIGDDRTLNSNTWELVSEDPKSTDEEDISVSQFIMNLKKKKASKIVNVDEQSFDDELDVEKPQEFEDNMPELIW